MGEGLRRGRSRRLSLLRLDPADAAVAVPRRHRSARHAPHRHLQRGIHRRPPAPALQEHHLSGCVSALLDIDPTKSKSSSASSTRARKRCSSPTGRRSGWDALRALQFRVSAADPRQRSNRVGDRISSTATAQPHSAACTAGLPSLRGIRSRRRRRSPKRSRNTAASSARIRRPSKSVTRLQAEDELAWIGMVIGAAWKARARSRRPRDPACR